MDGLYGPLTTRAVRSMLRAMSAVEDDELTAEDLPAGVREHSLVLGMGDDHTVLVHTPIRIEDCRVLTIAGSGITLPGVVDRA